MPSFDKIAKAFLEELRQARAQMNTMLVNQETLVGQNSRMLDLLQQIKINTSKREDE
ncbi:MAG: hypothetical protein GX348_03955 [Veillonellaceae bacterium]|jgi:hypothetical protein|nr:hypothetical protein [Veillonellaceae bacterium]